MRTGGAPLVVGLALLIRAPGLPVFALFYFRVPFAMLLIVVGTSAWSSEANRQVSPP